ncbi:hypothetical protein JQ581_05200 [Bradyrhizobium liaoningense]|uniref:hypothetical protein n=1 Tax=Bradyrhizobium liaoningense TaxID=43992 RepID=UPI001BAB2EF7|nr:hypothetical protein [Bradyrhizobium liaoningense]MBR0736318.1 hypothetical protein [Bradyrhizobium liaoningense]
MPSTDALALASQIRRGGRCDRSLRRATAVDFFLIARISSSHGFADSHDHLRLSRACAMKKRQKMTLIISIRPESPQRSPHKFVNVMA